MFVSLLVLVALCALQSCLASPTPIPAPPTILHGQCAATDLGNYTFDVSTILRERVIPNLRGQCSTAGFCQSNPATSCKAIAEETPYAASGDYWVSTCSGEAVKVYCDMGTRCCNSTSGWMRAAYLNMTDGSQDCPAGLYSDTVASRKRLCRRKYRTGCKSIFYSVNYMPYSRVCGRAIAYQEGTVDAFWQYFRDTSLTIDDDFIDGITISVGYPRTHVWSFAASNTEGGVGANTQYSCPCARTDVPSEALVPPFVENQYFCESGTENNWGAHNTQYHNDALWDGADCPINSSCCQLNNPPWFCRELGKEMRSDFEIRVCGDEDLGNEDIGLEVIEIYVQ